MGQKEAKPKAAKDGGLTDAASQRIFVFPPNTPLGMAATELGRLPTAAITPGLTVLEEWEKRKGEVRATLLGMEHGDKELVDFWQMTREWSLAEFRRIYAWLNVRFDHDFYESEVSEESRVLANEFYQRGVFINSNGAIGADLSAYHLGFCMVLKSDGSGLYATKDLALAKRKFDQFGGDKSIYIVDAAQSLHFQQVFKTLELMGYEQASQCEHIAYGQVVLSSGQDEQSSGQRHPLLATADSAESDHPPEVPPQVHGAGTEGVGRGGGEGEGGEGGGGEGRHIRCPLEGRLH